VLEIPQTALKQLPLAFGKPSPYNGLMKYSLRSLMIVALVVPVLIYVLGAAYLLVVVAQSQGPHKQVLRR
jgi:hypothetical protein